MFENYVEGTVRSADGTTIGFRRIGEGPAVLLVQGAIGGVEHFDELARSLARSFTVTLADRRGRGRSPCAFDASTASIAREVEDVDALLQESGARWVFGLSSGAIITLECARALPDVERIVVYEPPLYPARDVPRGMIARFHEEMADRRLAAALVTMNAVVRLGPDVLRFVRRAPLERAAETLLRVDGLRVDGHRGASGYAPLADVLPSAAFDFRVVEDRGDELATFGTMRVPALLLGGTASPRYLREALLALERTLPDARRIELDRLDHSGPWNADRGGAPERVAEAISAFFAA